MMVQISNRGRRANVRGWRNSSWVKKMTNRAMRRAARRDPENAPVKRPTKGWAS